MKFLLRLLATVSLGLSLTVFALWLSARAQSHTFAALDTDNQFTGLNQFKDFENVQIVDFSLVRGGSDIGAEINLAYAALPYVSTGTGKIDVYPPATNSCYSYSTAILLNTNNKPVVVDFHGACLIWTPTTGIAMTLDTGTSNTIVSSALLNGHLTGPGTGTPKGVVLGVVSGNGCQFCTSNMEVDNFQTGMTIAGFNIHLNGVKITGPGTSGSVCLSAQGSDDVRAYGGSLTQCAKLFSFDTASTGPVIFFGTTFIEAKGGSPNVYISQTVNERLYFVGCHFSALTQAPLYLNQTNGRAYFVGGAFEDDRATGSVTSYIGSSGNAFISMEGMDITSSGETASEFISFASGATGTLVGNTLVSTTQIPLLYADGSSPSRVVETGTIRTDITPVTDTFGAHSLAIGGHVNQTATGNFGGSCAMSAATTCKFSIGTAFTGTPLSFASIDAASTVPATANSAKCSVSGTTVTITAGISNSLTWDCLLIGNPK